MNFDLDVGISAITVFFQGLLSFLSPCVLPLVPLYIGYLSGGTGKVQDDGTIEYERRKVLINTLFFIVGISFAFFLLGFGFTAFGQFFKDYRMVIARTAGVIIILLGLFQLFGNHVGFLGKEHRLPFNLERFRMNPLVALVLGFTFSFAWTPCVGPALTSVLLMATSSAKAVNGYLLIGVYTLGFVIPFLAVGFFTSAVLNFFKRHRGVVKYTAKIGGALMVVIGVLVLTGLMDQLAGYLSKFGTVFPQSVTSSSQSVAGLPSQSSEGPVAGSDGGSSELLPSSSSTNEKEPASVPAPDFTFKDQFGVEHTLSEYKGKVVFLNYWATWCPPCKAEMPEIQALYDENGQNEEDVIVLGVAGPNQGQEGSEKEIAAFLESNKYTYPTVMDLTGETLASYGITAFPTTFMIDREGNIFGYISGQLTRDVMDQIIEQTKNGIIEP